jgi:nucleoside-diphosphate-sugar epimerase
MGARVVIFGGHGFMGRHLAPYLIEAGYRVATPTRAEVDVSSLSALKECIAQTQPEAVINLAGISMVTHRDVAALYETNMLGHLRVLQAVSEVSPRSRVFLASSANIYGNGAQGQAFTETAAPNPVNHYAMSKLAAELLHRQFSGLGLCAVRPFNCIGRGQPLSFLTPKLVSAFRRRQAFLELGNVDIQRDFVDIRDVCVMWGALLTAPSPPEAVNFGNGEAVAVVDILSELERLSGHSLHLKTAQHLVRTTDITYQRADNGVISALGYRRRHSLEDTLGWMLAGEDDNGEA